MEFVSQPDKLLNKLMLKALLTVQLIGPETEYDKHYFPCLIRFHDVLLIMFFSGSKNAEDDIVIDEKNPWKGKSSKLVCKYVYFNLFSYDLKVYWITLHEWWRLSRLRIRTELFLFRCLYRNWLPI